jgi:hypothetical protein
MQGEVRAAFEPESCSAGPHPGDLSSGHSARTDPQVFSVPEARSNALKCPTQFIL